MLAKVLLLVTYCSLICSANVLEYFTDAREHISFNSPDFDQTEYIYSSYCVFSADDSTKNLHQIISTLSLLCHKLKHICRSFAVVSVDEHTVKTYLFVYSIAEINAVIGEADQPSRLIYAYDSNAYEDGAEKIVQEFPILNEEKAIEILSGYLPPTPERDWKILKEWLLLTQIILNVKPPRNTNIVQWIAGMDISRCERNDKMRVKSLETARNRFNFDEPILESASIDAFYFLDIFVRALNPDILTVFDPVKKTIFIQGITKDLVIKSLPRRRYLFAYDVDGTGTDLDKVASPPYSEKLERVFNAAKVRIGHKTDGLVMLASNIILPAVSDQEQATLTIIAALGILFEFDTIENLNLTIVEVFLRDFRRAVLALYMRGQKQLSFTKTVLRDNNYHDINFIVTTEKD